MMSRIIKGASLPFKPPFIVALYAPPGSGKTTAVKSIVRHYATTWNHIVVVCCSPSLYNDYDFIPQEYIHSVYEDETLMKLIRYQYENDFPPGLIIFDDCIAQMNFRSKVVRTLLTTYRHLNLSVIFCSQKIMAGSTEMRDYANFNLVFRQPNNRTIKYAADELLPRYNNWQDLKTVMDKLPKYSFILAERGKTEGDYPICSIQPVKHFRLNY